MTRFGTCMTGIVLASALIAGAAQAAPSGLKREAVAGVDKRAKLAQEINDSVFSFAELGFQEVETARYLTELLE